tara:strand:- start:748 stop:1407 length:660 start_codon:yes stop_codon:yes gene_type:complete
VNGLALRDVLKLLQNIYEISDSDLAKETNIPQPTIHRLRSGMSPDPKISTIKPIADFFNVTIGQICGIESLPANIHNKDDLLQRSTGILRIPILSWEQAITAQTMLQSITPFNWGDWTESSLPVSHNTYALKILHNYKNSYFKENSTIIVDEDAKPQERSFVIIKLANHYAPSIMIWLQSGGQVYLAPIQKELTATSFTKHDIFCGVVVETKINFPLDN